MFPLHALYKLTKKITAACYACFTFARYLWLAESDMYLSLGAPNILLILTVKLIKTESTRKLNNFNFQWTKTLYQNILSHTAFLFTLFRSCRYNYSFNNSIS